MIDLWLKQKQIQQTRILSVLQIVRCTKKKPSYGTKAHFFRTPDTALGNNRHSQRAEPAVAQIFLREIVYRFELMRIKWALPK